MDKVRIKIWDRDTADAVVYDNKMGEADDSSAATAIGGGSIVTHKANGPFSEDGRGQAGKVRLNP